MTRTGIRTLGYILAGSLLVAGCATDDLSPVPKSATAILVGMGTSCDKPELIKKGSDMDIASMDESIRFCYGDSAHYKWDTGYNNLVDKEHTYYSGCLIRIFQSQNATVAAVKSAIKAALDSELAIIYFSCKATQVPAAAGDTTEADGLDEALQLYDGLLLDNDIWDMLKTTTNRVFIVFDTSHSGTMFRSSKGSLSGPMLPDLVKEIEDKSKNGNLNMVCWSACNDEESIDERSIGSRMTNAFYLKYFNKTDCYDRVFERMVESTKDKQSIIKTVVGEDFSSKSVFR